MVLPIAILTMVGGLGCMGDTVASPEPEGVMQGINIYNVPLTLQPGQVHMLGATGLYPGNGTYNITGIANWSSSNYDVIELLDKGIIRAKNGGKATISVSYKGISQSIEIEVAGPALEPGPGPTVLSSIDIKPVWISVKVGETAQFEATAVYSNGTTQPITNLVDWRVSNNAPGFIVDADNSNVWGANYGMFHATALGVVVVSAYYADMVSNYATVVIVNH